MLVGRRWRPIAPLSRPRCHACTAVFENELWVIGGDDCDHDDLATVEAYNTQTNTWRSLPSMGQRRRYAVCGVVGGSLVVAAPPPFDCECVEPQVSWCTSSVCPMFAGVFASVHGHTLD